MNTSLWHDKEWRVMRATLQGERKGKKEEGGKVKKKHKSETERSIRGPGKGEAKPKEEPPHVNLGFFFFLLHFPPLYFLQFFFAPVLED